MKVEQWVFFKRDMTIICLRLNGNGKDRSDTDDVKK